MRIEQPPSLDAALALMAGGARAVAGGTALHAQWAQGVPRPDRMAVIGPLLPAGISAAGVRLRIGAGTTLSAIEAAGIPLLSAAMTDIAAPNIRRLATLGGSIGWGAGCILPALLAMAARVETTHGDHALEDWLAAPRGIVLAVTVDPAGRPIWRKIGRRAAFSPAVIVAAGMVGPDGPRLAVGGGVVRPARLAAVEAALAGYDPALLDPAALVQRIASGIEAPDCAFRSAAYRARVAANALCHGLIGALPVRAACAAPRPVRLPPPMLASLSRAEGGARWHTRPDMPAKVRGALPYLTDHRRPDMLVGRVLRAAHPHALILAIDTAAAEALPGVVAVITHRDVPGLNGFGIVLQDQPALCSDKVRYDGDAVAAVAAVDAATAERALGLIRVEYAPLPVVTDPLAALAEDAPKLHESGNLVAEIGLSRGDLAEGWARAVHVVEDTYVTPRQMHVFLETEGGWAAPEGDGLIVAAGGQHGGRDRMQLARITGLPESAIRVITSPVGGGFGGKDELTVQPVLALLALKARAPVRLQLSRAESTLAGTKRNPFTIRMRTGCDAAGRLVAQEVEAVADCGAYASLSPGVLETAMEHCAGPYEVADIRTRGRLAYTNNGTGGAFRGFGANQMTFAIECQMDRLAALAGLDPVEIRRRNLRLPGTPGYLGQQVAPSERLFEMLAAASASPLWTPLPERDEVITATGMAINYQGSGLGSALDDRFEFGLRLRDGRIEALCGLDEMGQGLWASLHAALAERLGCARSDIGTVTGDTGLAPDSGSTTASRGGYVVWRGVAETAPVLAAAILERAGRLLGRPATDLAITEGGVGLAGANAPEPLVGFRELGDIDEIRRRIVYPATRYEGGNARFIFAFGVTLARVEIDRISGEVRVRDMEIHTAAGPVLDMAAYLGQMEGGLVQGQGFTLSEDMLYGEGRAVTRNLDSYLAPTVMDAPRSLRATALESLDPGDPYGARGVGEIGIGAVTPAIANAVGAALGGWPSVCPFPPEAILDLLEGRS